jgi:hypothetical protein
MKTEIERNSMEFPPIPVSLNSEILDRIWVMTRWVNDDRIIREVAIPKFRELDGTDSGIGRYSGFTQFWNSGN